MPGLLVGEIVSTFCGFAICIPLFYQLQSQLKTPTKSPLPRHCWLLWSLGYVAIGAFFLLVPREPKEDVLGEPKSPRMIGCFGLIAATLCQILWALDGVPLGANLKRKLEELVKYVGFSLLLTFVLVSAIGLVRGNLIKSRVFYRNFLGLIAYFLATFSAIASLQAANHLSLGQITQALPEVAGLHWIPVVMQMLGYLAAAFTCMMLYEYPEWIGIGLLGVFFVIDGVYIGALKYRASRSTYSRVDEA